MQYYMHNITFLYTFRVHQHSPSESIKSHTSRCVPRTTSRSLKRCGRPIEHPAIKDVTNMDFKRKIYRQIITSIEIAKRQINFALKIFTNFHFHLLITKEKIFGFSIFFILFTKTAISCEQRRALDEKRKSHHSRAEDL